MLSGESINQKTHFGMVIELYNVNKLTYIYNYENILTTITSVFLLIILWNV